MPTVLIVDDNSKDRRLLRVWLEGWKFDVREASDATEALQRMAPSPADIILCDIRMSGHDGLWLLGQIHQTWPQTAVIMVTAIDDLDIVTEAQHAGAVGYITKPIGREYLRELLMSALKHIADGRNSQVGQRTPKRP